MDEAIKLLKGAAIQFRYYEKQHRAKETHEANVKADVNEFLAEQIETHLHRLHCETEFNPPMSGIYPLIKVNRARSRNA